MSPFAVSTAGVGVSKPTIIVETTVFVVPDMMEIPLKSGTYTSPLIGSNIGVRGWLPTPMVATTVLVAPDITETVLVPKLEPTSVQFEGTGRGPLVELGLP